MAERKKKSSSKTSEASETSDAALPADFRTLLPSGFDHHLQNWQSLVSNDRLPPVLLLDGRAGLGKRKLAASLTAMFLCEATATIPCGQCQGCHWFLAGEHPEVLWLEHDNEPFTVADAQLIQEHLELKPSHGARRRIVVLIGADQLTVQAANRLLKTLEEPPESGVIVMTTSRRRQLLPTVLSRAVRWQIAPPPAELSREHLAAAYINLHGSPAAPAALDEWLRRSALAPERAIALMRADAEEDQGESTAESTAELLRQLSASGGQAPSLQAAEQIGRRKDLSAVLLLQNLEIQLNDRYRKILVDAERTPPPLRMLRQRRQLLREAKRLASRGRVPLNTQLVAEAFAMSEL